MYASSLPNLTTLLLKDFFELSALTYLCYRWLRWLQQDKQKPLLNYFYGYCTLWVASTFLQLSTMLFVLEYSMPLIMMLFVLVHQHSLQKNFVSLYKVKPAQKITHNWLQDMIRFCLQADSDLYFLIEHTTSLSELTHTEILLRTPLQTPLLQFIAQAPGFNPEQYILADTQGTLLGVNVTWKKPLALTALEEQHIEKASYYLIDSDGYMLHYAHKTRNFTIIIRQKIYPGLSAAQVLQSITHYLHSIGNKQGTVHETRRTPSSIQPSA